MGKNDHDAPDVHKQKKINGLAEELKKHFLDNLKSADEFSVFLCGGAGNYEKECRKSIGDGISKIVSRYTYSVHYPEDLFIELLLGHHKHDLLGLENLLATSVNAVVILLQSAGTLAELGAFTNHSELCNKLIVVVDPKHERERSFINYGPLRFLKQSTKSKVLYHVIDKTKNDELIEKIVEAVREVSKHQTPERRLANPVYAYKFYLALVYVFDPITKAAVEKISEMIAPKKEVGLTVTSAQTVMHSLIAEKKISSSSAGLSITAKGMNDLLIENKTKKKAILFSRLLTTARLNALNLTLRR